ncbi:sugar-transfer associated ATP-grasp domain-containing protein [Natrialbaceae archaeon A-CW3]
MKESLWRLKKLVKKEIEQQRKHDVKLSRSLWLWRHGFLSEADPYYDFERYGVDRYLSHWQRMMKTKDINGHFSQILNDKLIFHKFISTDFPQHVPNVYFYFSGGRCYSIDEHYTNIPELLNKRDEREFILKPREGGGGQGVYLLKQIEGASNDELQIKSADGSRQVQANELVRFDDYLLSEYVKQDSYSSSIFSKSSNTLRILTMIDPKTNEPFVAGAIHRFGVENTAPLDNFSQGGGTTQVDLDTGELGKTAFQSGGELDWVTQHIETEAPIEGVYIPSWDTIVDNLLKITESLSFIPYIGWDVIVINDQGKFSIAEANSYPDPDVLQIHKPLLNRKKVNRFYRYHSVV